MHRPVLVDLFSGCGGFGLGGELAGFHSAIAVDIDQTLQSAYRLNFPGTRAILEDISTMNEDMWRLLLKDTVVDGVIGGPPCQGYSRMGRNSIDDPRRQLLKDFFRVINIIKPKFFVMENVEGLMDKKNRCELDAAIAIVDSRYTILRPIIVDASNFGVPTRRKRVLVIGFDSRFINPLYPDLFISDAPHITVEDAISDLPNPIKRTKDTNDFGWAPYKNYTQIANYAKQMRGMPQDGLGASYALNRLKKGMSSGHFRTIHTQKVGDRYKKLAQGTIDSVSRSKKLSWDGICPTLRAGTGSDKGSYQAVRPIHPDEGRVITVREAARLQGFPDWFCFHPTIWHSFRMIGNSVSPIMSKQVLETIHKNFINYQLSELKV